MVCKYSDGLKSVKGLWHVNIKMNLVYLLRIEGLYIKDDNFEVKDNCFVSKVYRYKDDSN